MIWLDKVKARHNRWWTDGSSNHLPRFRFESVSPSPNGFWWRLSRCFFITNHLVRRVCWSAAWRQILDKKRAKTLTDYGFDRRRCTMTTMMILYVAEAWVLWATSSLHAVKEALPTTERRQVVSPLSALRTTLILWENSILVQQHGVFILQSFCVWGCL